MTIDAPHSFLVADVGGTNTRVSLSSGRVLRKETIQRYSNAAYPGLEAILQDYLKAQGGIVPDAACVDIAGPVRDGKGRLTNRDWSMDEASIATATGVQRAILLNDLQAQGYAVDHLAPEDLLTVKAGPKGPVGAAKLVVNLGTGFNASPVFYPPAGAYVATSESGHATLPIRDAKDLRLSDFIARKHGFAAIDDVLSGRGLERIYAFLSHEAGAGETRVSAGVMEGCASKSDPIAVEAVHYFIRLTALAMSNLALVQLPFGGIFLVGGLSSAVAPFMDDAGFHAAFRDKGRFATFMDDFAVHVVQDDYAALRGMAAFLDNRLYAAV